MKKIKIIIGFLLAIVSFFAGISNSNANISTAQEYACGIKENGEAQCWGSNSYGRASAPPGVIFKKVASGDYHSCGIKEDGTVQCWGDNYYGKMNAPSGVVFEDISLSESHSCGIKENGEIQCWGNNNYGQSNIPTGISFKYFAAGPNLTCGIKEDLTSQCWGLNASYYSNLIKTPSGTTFKKIVLSGHGTVCGIKENGEAQCWGNNNQGQVNSPSGIVFKDISTNFNLSCGIKENGEGQCWGRSDRGQANVPSGVIFKGIYPSMEYACGIKEDGKAQCWGSGSSGRTSPPDVKFKVPVGSGGGGGGSLPVNNDVPEYCSNLEYYDGYAYTPLNSGTGTCEFKEGAVSSSYDRLTCGFTDFTYEARFGDIQAFYNSETKQDVLFNQSINTFVDTPFYNSPTYLKFSVNKGFDYIRLIGTDGNPIKEDITIAGVGLDNLPMVYRPDENGYIYFGSSVDEFDLAIKKDISLKYIERGNRIEKSKVLNICNSSIGDSDIKQTLIDTQKQIEELTDNYLIVKINAFIADNIKNDGEDKNIFLKLIEFITPYLDPVKPDLSFKFPFIQIVPEGNMFKFEVILIETELPVLEDTYNFAGTEKTQSGLNLISILIGIAYISALYGVFGFMSYIILNIVKKAKVLVGALGFGTLSFGTNGNLISFIVFGVLFGVLLLVANSMFTGFISTILVPLEIAKHILTLVFNYLALTLGDYSFYALFVNSVFSFILIVATSLLLFLLSVKFGRVN